MRYPNCSILAWILRQSTSSSICAIKEWIPNHWLLWSRTWPKRVYIFALPTSLSLHLSPSLWFLFISLSRNQIPLPLIDRKNALRFVFILYLTVKLISPKSIISHPFLHLNALFCSLPSPLRPTSFILKSNRNNKTMTQRVHDTYYNVQQAET